jgi:hypothetical protein
MSDEFVLMYSLIFAVGFAYFLVFFAYVAGLYSLLYSFIGISLGVAVDLGALSYLMLRREKKRRIHFQVKFRKRIMELETKYDKVEALVGDLAYLKQTVKDLTSRPMVRYTRELSDIRSMIESVKENGDVFISIVNEYDRLRLVHGKEFIDNNDLAEAISKNHGISPLKARMLLDRFRISFPEYVLTERDRRGKIFVRIRKP